MDIPATKADGTLEHVRSAKMIAVLKGVPDPVLRHSTAEGMEIFFSRHAGFYSALLNQLHGIRLTAMKRAGVEPLDVSLAQNRMSREAFEAIREAIRRHLGTLRRTVTLRAPFMGEGPMHFEDLMAPCPQKTGRVAPPLPYGEGIGIVKASLSKVNPEMGDFVEMMLEKGWIDAKPSDKKIGGAFYSRFNEFKIPRVFTTYLDSITSVFQQGHELGHAYHYWMMRDLPMIETEFPMTLTETASTFNEAVIRRSLFEKAEGDERFAMLWQELKSAANFLLQDVGSLGFEL
ncbi:peptidase family M3, partial [gut metagenome]